MKGVRQMALGEAFGHAGLRLPYQGGELLAIDPAALMAVFPAPPVVRVNRELDSCTIIDIRGPLTHHTHAECDSYEAIRARAALACARSPQTVVMCFDSPGGSAAGLVDAARAVRDICKAAGKTLLAFAEGTCASAAYGLACAAERVIVSEAAVIGSIGVLRLRPDYSAMNARNGFRVGVTMSGARKADGQPDLPISEAEQVAAQEIVDASAAVLFDLVAEMREVTSDELAGLDAKVFYGQAAVGVGLADEVSSFDTLLAALAAGPANQGNGTMKTKMQEARAALEEAAKGDGDEAKIAARALAAMDKTGDDDKGDDDDKAASDDADKTGDDDKGDKASSRIALEALAKVHRLEAKLSERDVAEERKTLIASRPDFAPEMVAALQTAPMKTVRQMCKTLPKGPRQPVLAAAAATAGGTRGAGEGEGAASRLSASDKAALDLQMGLHETQLGVVDQGNKLILGAVVPKAAPVAAAAPITR